MKITVRYSFAIMTLTCMLLLCGNGCNKAQPNTFIQPFEAGIVSTLEHNEWDITFLSNDDMLYFTRQSDSSPQQIYRSILVKGRWSEPRLVKFAMDRDEGIHFDEATNRLFFASTQGMPGSERKVSNDMNIWYYSLHDGEYENAPIPLHFNEVMGSTSKWPIGYESGPTTDSEGNLYFWKGNPERGDSDIYFSRFNGTDYDDPILPNGSINSESYESSPCISPDGKYLLFASYDRQGGMGQEDIWYSKNNGGVWDSPQLLGGGVNTVANESFPRFSNSGKDFFFSSDRDTSGKWSIYTLPIESLGIESFNGSKD